MSDPRATILGFAAEETVPLPGIEGAFVRRLSIAENDRLVEIEAESGLHLLTLAVVDADAKPLFTTADFPELRKIKTAHWRRIMEAVTAHQRPDGGDAEGAAKN